MNQDFITISMYRSLQEKQAAGFVDQLKGFGDQLKGYGNQAVDAYKGMEPGNQQALMGAGIGAGAGAGAGLLSSLVGKKKKKHPIRSMMTGALAGGAVGGLAPYAYNKLGPSLGWKPGTGSVPAEVERQKLGLPEGTKPEVTAKKVINDYKATPGGSDERKKFVGDNPEATKLLGNYNSSKDVPTQHIPGTPDDLKLPYQDMAAGGLGGAAVGGGWKTHSNWRANVNQDKHDLAMQQRDPISHKLNNLDRAPATPAWYQGANKENLDRTISGDIGFTGSPEGVQQQAVHHAKNHPNELNRYLRYIDPPRETQKSIPFAVGGQGASEVPSPWTAKYTNPASETDFRGIPNRWINELEEMQLAPLERVRGGVTRSALKGVLPGAAAVPMLDYLKRNAPMLWDPDYHTNKAIANTPDFARAGIQ